MVIGVSAMGDEGVGKLIRSILTAVALVLVIGIGIGVIAAILAHGLF